MGSQVTALGSLTPFTAPASYASQNGIYFFPSGDLVQGPTDIANCMPKSYVPSRSAYYSDSTCPPGFTIACSSLVSSDSAVFETAYTCCQTILEYACNPDGTTFYAPWFTTLGCSTTWAFQTTIDVTSVDSGGSTSVGAHIVNPSEGISTYSVQIRVPNSDTPKPSSSEIPVAKSSISLAMLPSATDSMSGATAPTLNSGAIAGIAIGSAIGGILLATAISCWLRRRTRGHSRLWAAANQAQGEKYRANFDSTTYHPTEIAS
ncbi:hypothetical protein GGR58DRAFT_403926 [Xylaria digitata]|nr:hypothetical protein GGR58DRAFT_403926 [Xylaria digitata]